MVLAAVKNTILTEFVYPASIEGAKFPRNGVGSISIQRPRIQKLILSKALNPEYKRTSGHSIYSRGPFGSGKSFLLWLLGQELQALANFVVNQLISKDATGRVAVFMQNVLDGLERL